MKQHPETLALHAGWRADPATRAVAPPIYQTTSYQFENTQQAADLFALREAGALYTRIGNPTTDIFEKRMAALEGGAAAVAVASGQAASAYAVQNLTRSGDNIVSSTNLYGGTWNLFAHTLKEMGIDVRFVDPDDPQAFLRASDDKTRAWYAETLPNPKLTVFPIEEVANLGREVGIPLIVDNTSAPLICQPLKYGAAVVVYSATKYIGGHGTSIGGLIIDGGNFDWTKHPQRHPTLNTPDKSYHNAIWSEAAQAIGPIAFALRARAILLRDFGAALSPFNAFLFLQGIETLPLRMPRHCENAYKAASFLKTHSKVKEVIYPAFQTGKNKERADRYMEHQQYGGLVGFKLAGGREAGRKFIEALRLFYHVANIGDTRSLAIHPASTTHSQLTHEELEASGATEDYVRLSIGLEHPDDIIADLSQALDKAL